LKKVIAIFLLFVTLGTNAFVKASLHYCGESLTQIAFGNEQGDPCDCAETGNMDCCKDVEVKLIPFNDSVLSSTTYTSDLIAKTVYLTPVVLNQLALTSDNCFKQINESGPPLLLIKQQASFLSVFRI
jgi:hypothetical protein